MKFKIWTLLTLADFCLTAQYVIDKSCDNTDKVAYRDGIVGGWQEAVDMADNAFKVMTNHASDDKVQAMCKYILGEIDFNVKFDQAKATFDAVRAFSRDPSPFLPQDDAWQARRTNADVEIYCDVGRFVASGSLWFDTSKRLRFFSTWRDALEKCHDPEVKPKVGTAKASTWSSDYVDYAGYRAAGGAAAGIPRRNFMTPQPMFANSIDPCLWFLNMMAARGWPKIDAAMIETAKTEEFINALDGQKTPVDGLETMGGVFLHEMTHTNQGGQLEDVTENALPDGTRQCYGWRCVGQLHNVRNSDNINMLGIALRIWSLKHWVNENGQIIPL